MDTRRTFGWSEVNAATHLAKHSVAFERASGVFLDPLRLDDPNARFNYGEERRITVGLVDAAIVSVVYTMRGNLTWRISARPASRKECRRYDRSAIRPRPE